MQKEKQRGIFIVLEGLDRCGKSTQCQKLLDFFLQKGEKAEIIRFPERSTQLGQAINQYLKGERKISDQAIHLLFSANRWEYHDEIKNKLNQKINLIIDRYAYSGVVYSAAKGLDLNWCKNSDIGLLKPDICFYLEAEQQQLQQRGDFGSEIYEKVDFQLKVKEQYNNLMKTENWVTIDANRPIQEMHEDIKSNLLKIEIQDDIQILWIN